ncbi:aldolase/citrate lyase family protein [Thioclava sp. GXIMD4215]|uniref:HpcH/HpaI aldolase family protein n=1 Tax=Thioclava sp. GXIMD4215 TaxID=3131928 RepID=UPI00311AE0BE
MTDMPKNHFKAAMQAFEVQRGCWCSLRDPIVAEMLAVLGFDWLMFDTEHSPIDPATVLSQLQAVAPYKASSIVRPSCLNAAEIKKLLDLGAQTILVPMVQSAAMAQEAVDAVAYPPSGIRGVSGMTRATRFATVPGYHKKAREEICLIVQVESKAALDEIEAMAAVDGVDAIFVGPADLAASLGYPGEPSHPEVTRVVLEAIRRIRAAGKPPGILTSDPAVYDQALEAGAIFVAKDIDLVAMKKGLSIS